MNEWTNELYLYTVVISMYKIGFKIAVWTILWPNINYITMLTTFVTNTKSRRNIYLFKNNHNKTPNAVSYHGGLSSTLWT